MKFILMSILIGLPAFMPAIAHSDSNACRNRGSSLVVYTDSHRLYVCKGDQVLAHFRVALGRGGVGKMSSGDLKSPLGTYSIGQPRPSEEFHVFIPVGYPTKEQKKQGYTGGDIGIHGPARNFSGIGGGIFSGYVDWTQGCFAVTHDSYIEEIAQWVSSEKPKYIHIVDL